MASDQRPDKTLLSYASLATQLIILLCITIYGGKWADQYFSFSKPVLIWLLPLLALAGTLIKLVRDTSGTSKK
ncbi:hypothetical protein KACHI17_09510 [Sediminibacterium sp. KACHI17]|jgi:hypothetical protein|uniref:AtpZ/AtpI family protein n=1 Tax=Sediminibacterium sp. KACHI17 TaxID=1751071 RepID=A0AAT9GHV2_9BACT